MAQLGHIPVPPPGPQRPSRLADKTGKIPFKSIKASIQGETAYWIWGDLSLSSSTTSRKCPLIALHGGPGATHANMIPLSLLADDYDIPVIMYDQIGCGESTRFRDRKGDVELWTPELFLEELVNVVEWLRTEWKVDTFDIIGHSWGGRLAAFFAVETQHPGLRKLIIANTSVDLRDLHKGRAKLRATLPEHIRAIFARQSAGETVEENEMLQAVIYEFSIMACRTHPFPPDLMGAFNALKEDDTVYSTMLGFNMTGSLMQRDSFTHDRLHEITEKTCPGGLLVISGDHEANTDESVAGWFLEPTCKTKWIRYGLSSHFIMFEEAESYLRDIGMFLANS